MEANQFYFQRFDNAILKISVNDKRVTQTEFVKDLPVDVFVNTEISREGEDFSFTANSKKILVNKKDAQEKIFCKRRPINEAENSEIERTIYVDNIEDYISAVVFYREICLLFRINTLLRNIRYTNKEINELFEKVNNRLAQLQRKEWAELRNLAKGTDDESAALIGGVKNDIYRIRNSENHESPEVLDEIYRNICTYEKGEYFAFFRGVTHVYYRECPSIFRENNIEQEDYFYRQAKINHPDEFSNLRYLDRIAKMQHYEFPTRMLDVSSSPLVALYMSCNTVYSKSDKDQSDYAEVIVYFRPELHEKSYDSKAVLINAALVKLTGSEKEMMKKFIEGFDNLPYGDGKTVCEFITNMLVHAANERGANAPLTNYEKTILPIKANDLERLADKISTSNMEDPSKEGNKEKVDTVKTIANRIYKAIKKAKTISETFSVIFKKDQKEFEEFIKAYDRLLITARREQPSFENKIDIFSLRKSYHVQTGMTNDRQRAQAGSFYIAGLDPDFINNKMYTSRSPGYWRIIIRKKKIIANELKALNINDTTMIPDLTHRASYLKQMLG